MRILCLLVLLSLAGWAQNPKPSPPKKPKPAPAPQAVVPQGIPVQKSVSHVPVRYQAPVNNPNLNYRNSYGVGHHQRLQWTGVVTARQLERLQIQGRVGKENQKIDFATDSRTGLPANVKEGSRVVIDYDDTPEAGAFRALKVQVWPKDKPLPKGLTAPVVREQD